MKLAIALTGIIDVDDNVDPDTITLDQTGLPMIYLAAASKDGQSWTIETQIEEPLLKTTPTQ